MKRRRLMVLPGGARRHIVTFWSAERDALLLKLQSEGFSAAKIGAKLGISRDAVLGRSHRLRGMVFKSNILRQEAAKRETKKRQAEREREERALIAAMVRALKSGRPRNKAIRDAFLAGARLRAIAAHFGFSRQAAQQAVVAAERETEPQRLRARQSPAGRNARLARHRRSGR